MIHAQNTTSGPLDGLFKVSVVEDDSRALAAELERNALKIGLRSSLHNLAANQGATRERDLAYVGVFCDSLPSGGTETRHDVENTSRESGLCNELGKLEGRKGGNLRRLQDNSVTSCKSRAELPAGDQN